MLILRWLHYGSCSDEEGRSGRTCRTNRFCCNFNVLPTTRYDPEESEGTHVFILPVTCDWVGNGIYLMIEGSKIYSRRLASRGVYHVVRH